MHCEKTYCWNASSIQIQYKIERKSIMATGKLVIAKIENIDWNNETCERNAVKHEPCEIENFDESARYDECSTGETDSLVHKYAIDGNQEQNEQNLDLKELKQEDLYHSECSQKLSPSESNTAQLKSEDDRDVFFELIKCEAGEEQSSKSFRLCEVCSQNSDWKTDVFESTSSRSKCSCQTQNDMTPASLGLSTDPVSQQFVQVKNEEISGDEVAKEQDTSAEPWMLSKSLTKNDNNVFVERQMMIMTKIKHPCKFCSKFFSFSKLEIHERNHTEKKTFNCKICSMVFKKSRNLRLHERVHTGEKPFQCKICSKPFSQTSSLKVHERRHTGEKPYQCKLCPKSFGQTGHLKIHERSHTGEKPFRCIICLKTFTCSSNLRTHQKIHADEKQYRCKICSKAFTTLGGLTVHERIHTGEKPFQCKICSKAFTISSSLTVHERVHTGEKPYQCRICSKTFTTSGSLTGHGIVHTGEKPFQCKICSKTFTQASSLTVHEKVHTEEKPY